MHDYQANRLDKSVSKAVRAFDTFCSIKGSTPLKESHGSSDDLPT